MSTATFTLRPVVLDDVPVIAQLNRDAFEADRHTEMKALAEEPFDMGEWTFDNLPTLLKNPRCVILKAVDNESGEIMGYINWGFRGFPPAEMPVIEGRIQPPAAPPAPPKTQDNQETKESKESSAEPKPESDPVKRLVALTDADLAAWVEEVMPEGTRCIYIIGLSVSPKYQGRGVGSALLRFGTRFCDERGVFAWVHSSEPAWKMYQKCGFQTIRELDIDLDEYAPAPPPASEGPDAKWGHYVFRYMKYHPVNS